MSITLKEILSQPATWQTILNYSHGDLSQFKKDVSDKTNVFVGSGTSYYLSQTAASVFSHYTSQNALAIPSAEVIIYPDLLFPKSSNQYSAFLISRSGTTTEVLLAGDIIEKEKGIITSSITCRNGSGLTNYGKYKFILEEADEKSVVMTRSFTSMLFHIQLLADKISGSKHNKQLKSIPEHGDIIINKYRSTIEDIINSNSIESFVFLGQGPLFGLANESMLKVTEMSISISNAYHSLEFRHGPMSRVNKNTLITFFVSDKSAEYETKLINEMHKLGAKTLILCESVNRDFSAAADFVIELNSGMDVFENPILYMPITQLMGYYQAIKKGINPDNPQHLTQIVTL